MAVNQTPDSQKTSQFQRIGTEVAKKAAYGTMAGGLGTGIRKGAEQAYKSGVASTAQHYANRFRARTGKQEAGQSESGGKPKKKMVGPAFWFIMLLAVVKDLTDIIGDITVILAFLTILTGMFIYFIILFYLYYEGVSFDTRKMVTLIIAAVISMIPFLNLLPETVISLIMTRVFENNSRLKALAGSKVAGGISKVV